METAPQSNKTMASYLTKWSRQRLRFDFVVAEIELGYTFARIALSATHPEKFNRNRMNARKACDAATRFLRETSLSEDDRQQIGYGLAKLRSALSLVDDRISK
jgi:hypothetical protein